MSIKDPSDIRLNRQNDLEAIIGHPPGWTLRWGMMVLFVGTVLLIGISWLVQYPDVIEAPAIITTTNPPIRLTAGASARIASLYVENGEFVEKNKLLGVLDNPAVTEDVFGLDDFLTNMAENDVSTYVAIDPPSGLEVGSLQDDYARFIQTFLELQYILKKDIHFLKISNLRTQIVELEKLNASLQRQVGLLRREVGLYAKNVMRDSILFARNSLSEMEYEQSQSSHIAKLRELEAIRAQTAHNNLEIQQKRARILDLRQLQSDDQNERVLSMQVELERLQAGIDAWKNDWLLIAPISGEVALTNAWSEQQFVKAGEEVLTIVPRESGGQIIGKAILAGPGSGKIENGMDVQIRLNGFPYQEYGMLPGKVERIAEVPGQSGYEVSVALTNGMVSSYGTTLPFRQEMRGTVRIITKERSLLVRILEKIYAALKN